MVENLCVELRFNVGTAVGDCRVSSGQLQIGDAFRQTAQGKRRIAALVDADGRKTKITDIVISKGRSDFRKRLDCHNVDGIGDRFP